MIHLRSLIGNDLKSLKTSQLIKIGRHHNNNTNTNNNNIIKASLLSSYATYPQQQASKYLKSDEHDPL